MRMSAESPSTSSLKYRPRGGSHLRRLVHAVRSVPAAIGQFRGPERKVRRTLSSAWRDFTPAHMESCTVSHGCAFRLHQPPSSVIAFALCSFGSDLALVDLNSRVSCETTTWCSLSSMQTISVGSRCRGCKKALSLPATHAVGVLSRWRRSFWTQSTLRLVWWHVWKQLNVKV